MRNSMAKSDISRGNYRPFKRSSNDSGIIAERPCDHARLAQNSIGKAIGRDASDADLTDFKKAARVLTNHRTALLMDPVCLPAIARTCAPEQWAPPRMRKQVR